MSEWGHIRLFSPWSELVDPVAAALLDGSGWEAPVATAYPTGDEWVTGYLQPLADALEKTDEVEVRYGHRVVGVTRFGRDRLVDSGREDEPLVLQVRHRPRHRAHHRLGRGRRLRHLGRTQPARAATASPHSARPPTPTGSATASPTCAASRAGSGTPASTSSSPAREPPLRTRSSSSPTSPNPHPALGSPGWSVGRASGNAFGGGDNDQLEARGALGKSAERAAGSGAVTARTSFRTASVEQQTDGRLTVTDFGGQTVTDVDEIVAVTGFRPDLAFLSEVRLDLDPVLQSPRTLAPLIDPNVHSCGTVYPHGAKELVQPEPGFYLVGMKSYGRAPSFLTLTGCEQVRSVVAAIAGDHEAAERVELVLPDTGVCGGSGSFDDAGEGGGCCAPAEAGLLSIGGVTAR